MNSALMPNKGDVGSKALNQGAILRGEYQLQDSTMTLREGLDEYYRVNPGLADPRLIEDPESVRFFRCHDATHVFFGTHTGDLNEGVNDLLTLFGVDVTFKQYGLDFLATQEGQEILDGYKENKKLAILKVLGYSLLKIPSLYRRAKRMTKKWPWEPPPAFYDRPLGELRAEFGFEVFHPKPTLGLQG